MLNTPSFPSTLKKNIKHANIYGMARLSSTVPYCREQPQYFSAVQKVTTLEIVLAQEQEQALIEYLIYYYLVEQM